MKKIFVFTVMLYLMSMLSCKGSTPEQTNTPVRRPGEEITWGSLEVIPDQSPAVGEFRDLIEIKPDLARSLKTTDKEWYKDAVFYHIWVSAFNDSDGDNIGDIKGITQKLDYLKDLGVTALWLSPFFESASTAINLHMYDTTDHYKVDPRFGTNDDVDELLKQAHARGMRLIFDWVPNHISSDHKWFTDSVNRQNGRDDWFVWRNEPGSQKGPWGQSVWHKRGERGFFYGVFWSGMPDINFRSQGAKDAITNTALYWLNRGFDGMRIDAVKYIYEDIRSIQGGYADVDETFEYFTELRKLLDQYGKLGYEKFTVGENWTGDRNSLEKYMYYNGNKALNMSLDFTFAGNAGNLNGNLMARHWDWVSGDLSSKGTMGTFLSNHDHVSIRPASRHKDGKVRIAVALNLLGVGTPFIYYGNEIGMPDSPEFDGKSHADRRHRQPFIWSMANEQKGDQGSLLELHRNLIKLRNGRVSLRRGDFTRVNLGNNNLFAYERVSGSQKTLVLMNTSLENIEIPDNEVSGTKFEVIFTDGVNNEAAVSEKSIKGTIPGLGIIVWDVK